MSEEMFPPTGTTIQFVDPWTLPYDIICNGFSLKDTILEVLKARNTVYGVDLREEDLEQLAEDIKEALAVKLRFKQG